MRKLFREQYLLEIVMYILKMLWKNFLFHLG